MSQLKTIESVLIANRGEIACRIIRTCRSLGIKTVAVYSDADKQSQFVKMADLAAHLGGSDASDSYLNIEKLIAVCKRMRVDAIHPGYGFLSENAEFAKRCEQEQIIFIGPHSSSILAIGSKSNAKRLLSKNSPEVPLVPGYTGDDQSIETLSLKAKQIGFPILLKASAGGGGKGMRIVRKEEELLEAIDLAKKEAQTSFGDSFLLIERYFEDVRHIEFQIFGDNYGNVTHLFERECSVQRRHQKVIEETPSVLLTPELRVKMGNAAIQIGKTIRYSGAGTVEFVVTPSDLKFYFLEVNTRLQVEHPVTEMTTGLDLVALQIQIARGFSLEQLGISNSNSIKQHGHAIQCRLYAENPTNNFLPSVGKVLLWKPALDIEGLRYDSGIESGSEISIYYDPMVSKLIAYGPTRDIAIDRLRKALACSTVLGVRNNKTFLQWILSHPQFRSGRFNTHFIQQNFSPEIIAQLDKACDEVPIAALLFDWRDRNKNNNNNHSSPHLKSIPSGFRNVPLTRPNTSIFYSEVEPDLDFNIQYTYKLVRQQHLFQISLSRIHSKQQHQAQQQQLAAPSGPLTVELLLSDESGSQNSTLNCVINGVFHSFQIASTSGPQSTSPLKFYVHSQEHGTHTIIKRPRLPEPKSDGGDDLGESTYVSKMPGKVVELLVPNGSNVKKGQALLTTYSMKIQSQVNAHSDGIVKFFVEANQLFEDGQRLLTVEVANKK